MKKKQSNTRTTFKNVIHNPYFQIIALCTTVAVAAFGTGAKYSEDVHVNPLEKELADTKEKLTETEDELKQAKTLINEDEPVSSKYEGLVVYEEKTHREGDVITILGGQVTIQVDYLYDVDSARFKVDAAGEKFQEAAPKDGRRAKFKYNNKEYLISILDVDKTDLMDITADISISEKSKTQDLLAEIQ